MENESPFLAMQRAETYIKGLIRVVDTDSLSLDERRALAALRRLSAETRLDIRDYELSETREEQLKKAAEAKRRLDKLRGNLLAITDVLSPADIAQLDASLEYIKGRVV